MWRILRKIYAYTFIGICAVPIALHGIWCLAADVRSGIFRRSHGQ